MRLILSDFCCRHRCWLLFAEFHYGANCNASKTISSETINAIFLETNNENNIDSMVCAMTSFFLLVFGTTESMTEFLLQLWVGSWVRDVDVPFFDRKFNFAFASMLNRMAHLFQFNIKLLFMLVVPWIEHIPLRVLSSSKWHVSLQQLWTHDYSLEIAHMAFNRYICISYIICAVVLLCPCLCQWMDIFATQLSIYSREPRFAKCRSEEVEENTMPRQFNCLAVAMSTSLQVEWHKNFFFRII